MVERTVNFVLDGRQLTAGPCETIWRAAKRHGVLIPHLCLSTEPDFLPEGNCRVCMVEIEGWHTLAAACHVLVEPGMKISTESERAHLTRRLVMELLLADVTPEPNSEMAHWCEHMDVTSSRFARGRALRKVDDSHIGMRVNRDACIDCLRCVQACRSVECYDVMGMAGRSHNQRIVFDFDAAMGDSTCVSCGSCAQTCPTGAISFKDVA